MEKSGGVRPGGGAMYPGIPPMEVLGVVIPPEEEATPCPGVCSTIWLYDVGGADCEAPIHPQYGSGLQQKWQYPTPVATSNSWSKFTPPRPK